MNSQTLLPFVFTANKKGLPNIYIWMHTENARSGKILKRYSINKTNFSWHLHNFVGRARNQIPLLPYYWALNSTELHSELTTSNEKFSCLGRGGEITITYTGYIPWIYGNETHVYCFFCWWAHVIRSENICCFDSIREYKSEYEMFYSHRSTGF